CRDLRIRAARYAASTASHKGVSRPHPEERDAAAAPQTRARLRASRRMRTGPHASRRIAAPPSQQKDLCSPRVAMLLSMRAGSAVRSTARANSERLLQPIDGGGDTLSLAREHEPFGRAYGVSLVEQDRHAAAKTVLFDVARQKFLLRQRPARRLGQVAQHP